MNNKYIDILWGVMFRIGNKGLNLLVFILIARELTLSEVSIYGLIFSTVYLLTIFCDIGLRNTSAKFFNFEDINKSSLVSCMHLVWLLSFVLGSFFLVALLKNVNSLASLQDYTLPTLILYSSMLYTRMMQGILIGSRELKIFNKSETISRVFLAIIVCSLMFSEILTIQLIIWGLAVSYLLSALYVFIHIALGSKYRFVLDKKLMISMLKNGFMFMLAVSLMNVSKKLVLFVINDLGGSELAGAYFSLVRLTEVVTEVGLAVSVVMLSYSSANVLTGLESNARSSRITLLFLALLSSLFMVFNEFFITFALTDKYASFGGEFSVIMAATLIGVFWLILFPIMAAQLGSLHVAKLFMPAVLVLGLTYIYLSTYGIELSFINAVWLYLLSNTLTTLCFILSLKYKANLKPSTFILIEKSDVAILKSKFLSIFN